MKLFYRLFALPLLISTFCCAESLAAAPAQNSSTLAVIINSTIGKSLIVTFFFGIIALFLRFLYGPKGIMREKEWDSLNSDFKAAEASKKQHKQSLNRVQTLQKKLEPLTQKEGKIFSKYVASFHADDATKNELYNLKEIHSFGVFQNAWLLIQGEPELQKEEIARPLLLAAIYHDCGRFEQIRQHNSFIDKKSLDHALLGSKILMNSNFMPSESTETRNLVRGAVLLHSRAEIPSALRSRPESSLNIITRALRDADKIDIIRVMVNSLCPGSEADPSIFYNLPDAHDVYSLEAVQAVLERRPILSQHMKYCNDFRLRICGWAGLLEFESSRQILLKNGNIEKLLSYLPDDNNMQAVRESMRDSLHEQQSDK